MNKFFISLVGAALLSGAPHSVSAQAAGPALAEARGRVACGAGTLVSASYIGGGLIRVTCQQPSSQQAQQQIPSQSPLAGTGLTAPVVGGAVATVLVVSILTGSNGVGTTTTTTTTTLPVNVNQGER